MEDYYFRIIVIAATDGKGCRHELITSFFICFMTIILYFLIIFFPFLITSPLYDALTFWPARL